MFTRHLRTIAILMALIALTGAMADRMAAQSIAPHRAFLWDSKGEIHGLGDLGGGSAAAWAVNDRGEVAGYSWASYGERAFLWRESAGMQDIGVLNPTEGYETFSQAFGINNRGQVVGQSRSSVNDYHAFLWSRSQGMVNLGTPWVWSFPWAINDRGQVVGYFRYIDKNLHASLWEEGAGMQSLGDLGGGYSYAYAINDRGQVVGGSLSTDGKTHAFLWDRRHGMRDISGAGQESVATGINNRGEVIGYRTVNPGAPDEWNYGWIWDEHHGMKDIAALASRNSYPQDINDKGEIVGYWETDEGARPFYVSSRGAAVQLPSTAPEGVACRALHINCHGTIVGFDDWSEEWSMGYLSSRYAGFPGAGSTEPRVSAPLAKVRL